MESGTTQTSHGARRSSSSLRAVGGAASKRETPTLPSMRSALPVPQPQVASTDADLEQLRQQNQLLVSQLSLLTGIINGSPDAIVVSSIEGGIKLFNPAAEKMFRYDADLAMRDHLFYLLDTLLCDVDRQRVNEALGSHKPIVNMRVEIADFVDRRPLRVLLTLDFKTEGPRSRRMIVATVKDNSEAEAMARTDALTGLANRHELAGRLQRDQSRLLRGQLDCLSCIFIDVDHFGQFNKLYGQHVGDAVLREVGKVLDANVRGVDMAARYGGEEFVVLLPDTHAAGAHLVSERIRLALADLVVSCDVHSALQITASMGVSTHSGQEAVIELLLQEANEAMRAAKEGGRNQTRIYRHAR